MIELDRSVVHSNLSPSMVSMSRQLRIAILAALGAALPVAHVAAQFPQPPSAVALAALVDSVVKATLLTSGVPGVSVAITRGNETLVERAWGLADVTSDRAATPSTLYAIGSNSKQFTAALVLKLVDRGRLALTDSIGHHLSGLRAEWRAITIEQLLNHTSGLQRSFVDMARIEENLPGDSLIALAARGTMTSRPGTTFLYSNTGYLVLGVLIEKMYGKSYATALRDEIVRPLGLTALRACTDADAGTRATGYHRMNGTLSSPPPLHPSQTLGASGVCSTASDLAKWNRALHSGRVLSEASYRAMITPRGVAIPENYGFGLSVSSAPWGAPAITHGGQEVMGFTSEFGWYPADSLSVAILYNVFPRAAAGGTSIIAALALGRRLPAARTAAQPAQHGMRDSANVADAAVPPEQSLLPNLAIGSRLYIDPPCGVGAEWDWSTGPTSDAAAPTFRLSRSGSDAQIRLCRADFSRLPSHGRLHTTGFTQLTLQLALKSETSPAALTSLNTRSRMQPPPRRPSPSAIVTQIRQPDRS